MAGFIVPHAPRQSYFASFSPSHPYPYVHQNLDEQLFQTSTAPQYNNRCPPPRAPNSQPPPNHPLLNCHSLGAGVLEHFPIYVCVPEEEVAAVIDSCPETKREDLVFMASGCLEPLLKSRGLCRDWQTQATLYFRVDKVCGRDVLGWVGRVCWD